MAETKKKMKMKASIIVVLVFAAYCAKSQRVGSSPEYIKAMTAEWKGERLPDGRPKVSDAILERLKNISIEEAWGVLRNKGFQNQFEGDWTIINPNEAMTGRVVTAQYMPLRPDLEKQIKEQGKTENRAQKGGTNSWPIDMLSTGDVYVADSYGKIADGTLIGDNLGNSIYAKSQRGVIFYGLKVLTDGLKALILLIFSR
jgi:4-hydroxy-4-methyl-2-oxoglutarate aldolase